MRRTDKEERWFPFLRRSFTVLTARSVNTRVALVTLNHSDSLCRRYMLKVWLVKVLNQVYLQPQSPLVALKCFFTHQRELKLLFPTTCIQRNLCVLFGLGLQNHGITARPKYSKFFDQETSFM